MPAFKPSQVWPALSSWKSSFHPRKATGAENIPGWARRAWTRERSAISADSDIRMLLMDHTNCLPYVTLLDSAGGLLVPGLEIGLQPASSQALAPAPILYTGAPSRQAPVQAFYTTPAHNRRGLYIVFRLLDAPRTLLTGHAGTGGVLARFHRCCPASPSGHVVSSCIRTCLLFLG